MARPEIAAILKLQTTQFVGELRKVRGQLTSFGNSLQNIGKVLAGAFVIRGAARMINDVAKLGDELAKMSDKTGLSVETLNGLTQAAGLADVSQEQLSVGLRQLSKNLLDTTRGTGEAKESFEAMGITGKEAAELLKTPDEAFLLIADRLAAIPDTSTRAAEAMRIFGRSGAEMLPLLNQGRDAIAAQIAQLQKLRPITTEQARAAEAYNDAITAMGFAFQGLTIAATSGLIPALTKLFDTLTALISLDVETFQRNMRAILGGDFSDEGRLDSLKQQRELILSTIDEMEKSLQAGGGTTLFGLLPTNLQASIDRAKAQLAEVNADIKAIQNSQAVPKEAIPALPAVTVNARLKSAELSAQIATHQAIIKLIEAEEVRDNLATDRLNILNEEIARLEHALTIQKEIEAANKAGKERPIDPKVREAADIELQAKLLEIQNSRVEAEEERLGILQEILGADIQHALNIEQARIQQETVKQLADDEFAIRQAMVNAGDDASKIRGGEILLAEANINFLKKQIELHGETEERRRQIRDLEIEILRIRQQGEAIEQEALGRGIVQAASADVERQIEPFKRAVRDAQAELAKLEAAPNILPETIKLGRIEVLQREIELTKELQRLGFMGAEESNRQFLVLDAQLRTETESTQRGFLEGWRDTFKQFTNDTKGAFGLGQVLARNFVTNLQSSFSSIVGSVFTHLEEGTLSWRTALETLPDILKQITQQFIAMALAQGIASAIGGGLGGLFGGGVSAGASNAAARGAANPNLFGPGFATGGSFTVGGPFGRDQTPVGFMASRGEKVTIETAEQQKRNGANVHIQIINQAGARVSQSESEGPDGRMIKILVEKQVNESIRRGSIGRTISDTYGIGRRGREG